MNFSKDFVEQLEEIDEYYKTHKANKLTALALKKIRYDFINMYYKYLNSFSCEHKNLIDCGYFNYENHKFVKKDNCCAKYHKFFCPECKNEIIIENKTKKFIKK